MANLAEINKNLESLGSKQDETTSAIQRLMRKMAVAGEADEISNLKGLNAKNAAVSSGADTANAGVTGSGGSGSGSGLGGMLGGLMKGFGGGVGLAGLGIGATLLGLAQVMDKFSAQGIKDGVNTLLSIGEDYESRGEFFKEGGTLAIMLGGLGAGLIAFGAGQLVTAGAQWLSEDNWAEVVKNNVGTLLEISSLPGAGGLGVDIAIPLGMISAGLIAFGIGQGVVGLAESLTKFTGTDNWAQNVRDNIEKLLEIPALPNATFKNVTAFPGVMAMISAGLIAFTVGSVAKDIAAVPTTAVSALKTFTGQDENYSQNWAKDIRDNVETLLEIPMLPGATLGNTGEFVGVMTMIGAGLIAFAFGKGAEGASETVQSAVQLFTKEDYAKRIKGEVETILSIPHLPNADLETATGFIGIMAAIGTGLAVFSLGKALDGAATGVQGAVGLFTEEGFANRIKTEVSTLLSITDLGDDGKATSFIDIMAKISKGLIAFSAGGLVGALADAGAAIIKFFTGEESAFEQIRIIANQSNELEQGATALESIHDSLNKIGGLRFDGSNLGLTEFANDLAESVPIIETAIMGSQGKDLSWWPFYKGVQLKGLASPDINFDEASSNIANLRGAMGLESTMPNQGGSSNSTVIIAQESINALTEAIMQFDFREQAAGSGTTIINNSNNGGGGGGNSTTVLTNPAAVGDPAAKLQADRADAAAMLGY